MRQLRAVACGELTLWYSAAVTPVGDRSSLPGERRRPGRRRRLSRSGRVWRE